MTKSKPKSKSVFPDDLYVVAGNSLVESDFFYGAATPAEMLAAGDKATVAIYRLVETCEMSADVVVNRKSVVVTRKSAKK